MNESKEMRLTGGTFFTLLIKGSYEKISSKTKASGIADPMSNTNIMFGLMGICDKNINVSALDNKSMVQQCSRYKNCELSYSQTYLPFNDDSSLVANMRKAFNYNPLNIYARAKKFVDNYIDVERKGIELVSALRYLIINDKAIGDTEQIYIETKNSEYITKKKFIEAYKEIDIASLISGVWYYIINKQVDNSQGKNTIDSWYPYGKNSRMNCPFWTANSEISLKGIDNKVTEEFIEETTSNDNDNYDDGIEIVDIKKEEEPSNSSSPSNPTIVFNQYGNNGTQIAHVENYYANSKKKEDK